VGWKLILTGKRLAGPVEREPMWDGNCYKMGRYIRPYVEREPMWDGNTMGDCMMPQSSKLSENQCGMETYGLLTHPPDKP